jgi:hypothetical protein
MHLNHFNEFESIEPKSKIHQNIKKSSDSCLIRFSSRKIIKIRYPIYIEPSKKFGYGLVELFQKMYGTVPSTGKL